jgi:hypothetical protein
VVLALLNAVLREGQQSLWMVLTSVTTALTEAGREVVAAGWFCPCPGWGQWD